MPLSVWRDRAKAQGRRTEYLARACRCGDMAVRARDAHDAQFLRAMTIVWQILAGKDADVHNAAHAPVPLNFAEIAPPARGRYEDSGTGTGTGTGTGNCFYGFGVGAAAAEAKRNAGIEKTTMLRILPDASWHAARHHPLHADQFSLLALNASLPASWSMTDPEKVKWEHGRQIPPIKG
ncbi:MAG: hypothetical protein WCE79_14655 [Xanthobacteraceae bacterium]